MTVHALGRLVEHDPRARRYVAAIDKPRTVTWEHEAPVLDQGNLGT